MAKRPKPVHQMTEAQFAASTDKGQALQMDGVIDPLMALGARWRGDQPDLLIIPDRLDVDAGLGGQRAYGKMCGSQERDPSQKNLS